MSCCCWGCIKAKRKSLRPPLFPRSESFPVGWLPYRLRIGHGSVRDVIWHISGKRSPAHTQRPHHSFRNSFLLRHPVKLKSHQICCMTCCFSVYCSFHFVMFLIHLWILQAGIIALRTLDGYFFVAEIQLCSTQTYLIIMTKVIRQWDELTSQASVVDLASFHFRLT